MSSPVRYLVPAACALVFLFSTFLAADATADTMTTLMTLTGEAAGDIMGRVSGAGDVNGDGYADVIVGSALNDAGGGNAGSAYVFYGGPGADAIPDLTLRGEAPNDIFGVSVAGGGDVNGDGYADVIVGAYHNDAGGADAGRAYVYYGGPSADGVADLTLTGAATDDQFGWAVADAGDVNGDGYSDLLVGSPHNDSGNTDAGRAYVYFGGPGADSLPDLTLTGEAANDLFGFSVSGAGDVNGDGYADVIVGTPYNSAGGADAGRAYVYYGGPGADAIADLTFTGTSADYFGTSVSNAGDLNADGFADVIVGVPASTSEIGANPGWAYVYYGGPNADAVADLILAGEAVFDGFGNSVAAAGDVNGDGFADVVVGAPFNDAAGESAGRAYVFFGGPSVDAIADLVVTEPMPATNDGFGGKVSGAGDVNGDGFEEIIVAAFGNDAGGVDAGRAYIFSLHAASVSAAIDLDPNVINLGSGGRWVTAYVELPGFNPQDIDLATVRLAGTIPADPKFRTVGDHDSDGSPDLMMKFSRPALEALVVPGINRLEVTGKLTTGQAFRGIDEVSVINSKSAPLSASVAPNPLNPSGTLTFQTIAAGAVRLRIFDLRGRLIRTLVDSRAMAPGVHVARIDGRGHGGEELASGVYFYRLNAGAVSTTGRFTILK